MLTALSNCVGDTALLMVIAWIINFGSCTYIFYLDFWISQHDGEPPHFGYQVVAYLNQHYKNY
jgi:hypothetical protein